MTQIENAGGADAAPGVMPAGRRIAFERLRERSDELELLISGLLAFALLTLPPRLLDAWVANEIHADGVIWYAVQFGCMLAIGLSYALGIAFVIHLAIRGYWVGLIGLKSGFPNGIDWDRLPLLGPVARAFYQPMVGELGEVIDRVDRTASVLFVSAIIIAIGIAWTGLFGAVLVIPSLLVGLLFPDREIATVICFAVLNGVVMLLSIGITVLDKLVARREAKGLPSAGLRRTTLGLLRVLVPMLPLRLIAPVQLTLQSNLSRRGFTPIYYLVPTLALVFGAAHILGAINFSLFPSYQVVTSEAVDYGVASAHYESLRGPADAVVRQPMIPADRIESRQLRLFIPNRVRLDNPLARDTCERLENGRNVAEGAPAAQLAAQCIASMWTVTLDGAPVPLEDFLPAERRDLGMRGLMGYIDLRGKGPGRHDLQLVWNPNSKDRGPSRRRTYAIPFWYDPDGS
ncbi:hypothetical protein P6166_07250 [Stenotrophomonas sp. HITSZ_GD]|uniref:hypothetical protein n=1 Tax=Stenotrophomonas sp. HITSZ_GD TaxID=3037248 RepID=UPI00240CFC96|nr:hypothetical protein [Stenotrophomonas sp. HITSZ_GD]MDG2525148.1 hypothetical protein [Stenotrophomonas sp. HITSZ_GD]